MFHLPLRATEGLVRSVIDLLGVTLTTPDHRTFSRRVVELTVLIGRRMIARPRHLMIDSTGLKVYGEGEWHARQHGPRLRTWR